MYVRTPRTCVSTYFVHVHLYINFVCANVCICVCMCVRVHVVYMYSYNMCIYIGKRKQLAASEIKDYQILSPTHIHVPL